MLRQPSLAVHSQSAFVLLPNLSANRAIERQGYRVEKRGHVLHEDVFFLLEVNE